MKSENVTKILTYMEEFKNTEQNILSTTLSITMNTGYVAVRASVPTEDKNFFEIDIRMYFDDAHFDISKMTYGDFMRSLHLLLAQETIRRINVLHNIK